LAEALASPTYRYEAGPALEGDPGRVVMFCPIHGGVLLTEGEVIEFGRPLTNTDFEVRDGRKFIPAARRGRFPF